MLDQAIVGLFWLGQVMFAASYVLKKLAHLRALTALGCLITAPYYLLRDEPLWSPLIWLAIYLSINTVHLYKVRRLGADPSMN